MPGGAGINKLRGRTAGRPRERQKAEALAIEVIGTVDDEGIALERELTGRQSN